ncbi:MAG: hypothetical protein IKP06_01500 [Elusimicrobiaceae bacterium]|jgi:hypothetical protein|nr:hypothetical protein [Elusimicrobiaceae bacterium]
MALGIHQEIRHLRNNIYCVVANGESILRGVGAVAFNVAEKDYTDFTAKPYMELNALNFLGIPELTDIKLYNIWQFNANGQYMELADPLKLDRPNPIALLLKALETAKSKLPGNYELGAYNKRNDLIKIIAGETDFRFKVYECYGYEIYLTVSFQSLIENHWEDTALKRRIALNDADWYAGQFSKLKIFLGAKDPLNAAEYAFAELIKYRKHNPN